MPEDFRDIDKLLEDVSAKGGKADKAGYKNSCDVSAEGCTADYQG